MTAALSVQLTAWFIPSPEQGVWHLGPVPVRAYALCIIAGVVAAVVFGDRRWVARGGEPGRVGDVAIWAVPFGLVGARLYHVATDHALYFSHSDLPDHNWHPLGALEVWNGGLGIWGAIAGGLLGAALACRHYGIRMRPLADALAPTLLLAQAIGRWGNYFNQELFGKPTTKPWGLEIMASKRPDGYEGFATFHPTFLYECIWNLGALGLVLWLDHRLKLGFGRAFALYVMAYCAGRAWIENLRIDDVEYNDVLGLRLNVWTSIVLFTLALAYFVIMGRRHRAPDSREESVYLDGHGPSRDAGAHTAGINPAGEASVENGANEGSDAESAGPEGLRTTNS